MSDSLLGNKFNTISDAGKKIVLTPSLFMRLLEWSKEDAKDDIALHQVFEKVMGFTDGTNPVGIDCYDAIVKNATGSSLSDEEDSNGEYYDSVDPNYCCHGYECDYNDNYNYNDASYPNPNECCHTYTVDYNDIDTYYRPYENDLLKQYDMQPTTITIDCTKEDCSDPYNCQSNDDCVYDEEISDIINLGKF